MSASLRPTQYSAVNSSVRKLSSPNKLSVQTRTLYQKYQHRPERDAFRRTLIDTLGLQSIVRLASNLENDGIVIFRQFTPPPLFSDLMLQYDVRMGGTTPTHVGHTFIAFGTDEPFLTSSYAREAVFHPLLLTLISYQLGGPIRLVDIRGKDTGPALTNLRDNGLHLDDSPYGVEYKILLLWEKGTTRGPRSQNFVAIPRSNHLVRVVPTEYGANFKSSKEITYEILEHPDLSSFMPFVIEAKDEKPLTVVFEASGVAHHRFRTFDKTHIRSCLILAFHVDDEFNHPAHHVAVKGGPCELVNFVMGGGTQSQTSDSNSRCFLSLLAQNRSKIAQKLAELEKVLVPVEEKTLSRDEVMDWMATIDQVPAFEKSRPQMSGNDMRDPNTLQQILIISEYDRHFDLDLALYPDRREVLRKSLRNRIRELTLDNMKMRVHFVRRLHSLGPIIGGDIVPLCELKRIVDQFCKITDSLRMEYACEDQSKALPGILQLSNDLGEALLRCTSAQLYRTNVLFLYWTIDELYEWVLLYAAESPYAADIDDMASEMLAHYLNMLCYESVQEHKC